MALAMVLILLLVAGGIVAVGMYIVENMLASSTMKNDGELRMNAALSGIERGKEWIVERITGGVIPRMREVDGEWLVTSDDLVASGNVPFERLVAYDGSGASGALDVYQWQGADVRVVIYDVAYEVGSGVSFRDGMPPSIRWVDSTEGMSAGQTQSYLSSNRGGSTGGVGPEGEMGFYLIRSTATMKGIDVTVEQGVVMRK